MLMALLLGIVFNFMGEEGHTVEGVAFASSTVLRVGVALLGARISVDLLIGLGVAQIALVVCGVAATILFGLAVARLLGHGWRFALLSAGSVAICGASAAMAINSILPRDDRSDERLIFTVLSVTVLSTIAMIVYPVIVAQLQLGTEAGGLFLGATIHDVAQVVGAGYSLSEPTGDLATLVKLVRVSLLGPVVLAAAVIIRSRSVGASADERPPLVPKFVAAFLCLATINSMGFIPEAAASHAAAVSRWALLVAIAGVGMKISLRRVVEVGWRSIALLFVETLFLACFILMGIRLLV